MDEKAQAALESRLHNWGAWARSGGSGVRLGRCGSAEGRYLSPPADEALQQSKQEKKEIQVRDAEDMEEVVSSMNLHHPRERRFLHDWYVDMKPPRFFRDAHGVVESLLRPRLVYCVGMLNAAIDHRALLQSRRQSNMCPVAPCVSGRDSPSATPAGGARRKEIEAR